MVGLALGVRVLQNTLRSSFSIIVTFKKYIIVFYRLFQCKDLRRTERIHEKLKCIFNYFRRVTTVGKKKLVLCLLNN